MTNHKQRWLATALLLLLTGSAQVISGQTVVTVRNNGDSANRVDLVIVSEGYTSGEMTKFANDVDSLITNLFAQEPYGEYQRYFNVHRVQVASPQSGADHPERVPQVFRDTVFDATYNCFGIQRLICVNTDRVNTVVSGVLAPNRRDMVLVLVNDPEYGGSGGTVAVSSTNSEVVEVVLHEQGHSFGLLADEYDIQPPICDASVEPSEPNATRETMPALIKWGPWIDPATPIPTTTTVNGVPGLYRGARYCPVALYRPTFNSKMRELFRPFEQINSEQLVLRIYNFVSPIDSSSPPTTKINIPRGSWRIFSVTTPQPFTHPLNITWYVDGVARGFGPLFPFFTQSLGIGPHTVEAIVRDATPMVRTDPAGLLLESRTWNVNVQ